MDIEIQKLDDITLIRLIGRLDSRSAEEAKDQILNEIEPGIRVLMDLTDLVYMSSAGVRVLLLFYREVNNQEGRAAIVGLSDRLQEVLSLTGFLQFFDLYNTMDEGKAALKA